MNKIHVELSIKKILFLLFFSAVADTGLGANNPKKHKDSNQIRVLLAVEENPFKTLIEIVPKLTALKIFLSDKERQIQPQIITALANILEKALDKKGQTKNFSDFKLQFTQIEQYPDTRGGKKETHDKILLSPQSSTTLKKAIKSVSDEIEKTLDCRLWSPRTIHMALPEALQKTNNKINIQVPITSITMVWRDKNNVRNEKMIFDKKTNSIPLTQNEIQSSNKNNAKISLEYNNPNVTNNNSTYTEGIDSLKQQLEASNKKLQELSLFHTAFQADALHTISIWQAAYNKLQESYNVAMQCNKQIHIQANKQTEYIQELETHIKTLETKNNTVNQNHQH